MTDRNWLLRQVLLVAATFLGATWWNRRALQTTAGEVSDIASSQSEIASREANVSSKAKVDAVRRAPTNSRLRVAFALAPALDPREFLDKLDECHEYRERALPWLEAAAVDGDVVAVIALARVYGDMRRTSPRIPPFHVEDDERFAIYPDLMQRYGSSVAIVVGEAEAARQRLSQDLQRRARERADALYRSGAGLDSIDAKEAMRALLKTTLEPGRCG